MEMEKERKLISTKRDESSNSDRSGSLELSSKTFAFIFLNNIYCFVLVAMAMFLVTSSEELLSKNPLNSSVTTSNFLQTNIDLISSKKKNYAEDISTSKDSPSLNANYASSDNSTDLSLESECPEFDCVAVFLTTDEYNLMDDGRLHLHKHNKIFEKCEFLEIDDGAAVCHSKLYDIEDELTDVTIEHNRILSIITAIGLLISIVFIILHLVLFLFIPKMRNLQGCCLASLCVALLFAYIHFLIAATIKDLSKNSCIGVAMCIYYFFLASFFWMNVIAFDVWRSLRAETNRLKVLENELPKRRFLFYSLYAWLIPMSLAILTHQIDSSDHIPHKYRPRFADVETGMCWFKETHSMLLLFIIPFVVLMCLNILLFVITAYIIVTMSSNSPEANKKMLVRKFYVFLRLALIMGLTWMSGIIVSFTHSTFMNYVFVISNAFQGLFIFLAFSCQITLKMFLRCLSLCGYQRSSRTKEVSMGPMTSTCDL